MIWDQGKRLERAWEEIVSMREYSDSELTE